MVKELQARKKILVQQLKELNKQKDENLVNEDVYIQKKNEIERELVEIMDRLTQLAYLLK